MRVRLRAPGGQHTAELADDATVGDLKATVFDKTGVAPAVQELKAGFPPKTIEGDDGTSLASVGVTNGESITVAEVASAVGAPPSAPQTPLWTRTKLWRGPSPRLWRTRETRRRPSHI